MSEKKNSEFGVFFDKISWLALTAVAIYVASQLNKMSESVVKLNENVAIFSQQIKYTEKLVDTHTSDIKEIKETLLERRKRH